MTRTYEGRVETLAPTLRDDGIRYGLSVGRRSPMHQMHVDCLHEIVQAGLMPVVCIGSANDSENRHFDPVKSPLTLEQQLEQLRIVAEREFPEQREDIMRLAFGQPDVGNADKWSAAIATKLRALDADNGCVMHFRAKDDDRKTAAEKAIQPLSRYADPFAQYGISVWQSHNHPDSEITLPNPLTGEAEELSASTMRKWDLHHLTPEQRNTFAAPDYIIDLATNARASNPDRAVLDKAGIPVSMLDLSLERALQEFGIDTRDIVEIAGLTDDVTIESLQSALSVAIEERFRWRDKVGESRRLTVSCPAL
jgi:hypothetical protein